MTVQTLPRLRRRSRGRYLRVALGVVAALVVLEAGLRLISSAGTINWLGAPISADADSPVTEIRQYHEGVATARFSAAFSRLTGNPFLAGAETGVLVGDSYLMALQVPDEETIGSRIERMARAQGTPLNVRQYGKANALATAYVAMAPEIMQRWDPTWVVVVINANDLLLGALKGWPPSRLRADTTLEATAPLDPPLPDRRGWKASLVTSLHRLLLSSSLAYELYYRLKLVLPKADPEPAPPGSVVDSAAADSARLIPRATVRSLRRAFGDRLLIAYLAYARTASSAPDSMEARVLAACWQERVDCVSTKGAMQEARERTRRLPYGFANTAPDGRGHLNALGHAVVADVVWRGLMERHARQLRQGRRWVQ